MAAYRSYQKRYTPFSERRMARKSRNKLIFTLILSAGLLYFFLFWFLPTLIGGVSFLNKKDSSAQVQVDNTVIAPPVLNIPYEATNSSPIVVKGYSSPGSHVQIYVDDDLKSSVKADSDGSFSSDNIDLSLGRNNITGKTLDDQNHTSNSSKTIVVIYDNQKPKLDISEPQDGQVITGGDKKVKVSGTTDDDSIVVTINGTRVIVDSSGHFSQTFDINEGDNNFNIKALDQAGNLTEINKKVSWKAS